MINWTELLGQSIFYSTILITISTLNLSSTYDIFVSANTQDRLDYSAESIRLSLVLVIFGFISIMLIMYNDYGLVGLIVSLIIALGYIIWIYYNYYQTIQKTAKNYNLIAPKIFYIF